MIIKIDSTGNTLDNKNLYYDLSAKGIRVGDISILSNTIESMESNFWGSDIVFKDSEIIEPTLFDFYLVVTTKSGSKYLLAGLRQQKGTSWSDMSIFNRFILMAYKSIIEQFLDTNKSGTVTTFYSLLNSCRQDENLKDSVKELSELRNSKMELRKSIKDKSTDKKDGILKLSELESSDKVLWNEILDIVSHYIMS